MSSRFFLGIILLVTIINFYPTIFNEYNIDDYFYLSQLEEIHQLIDLPIIFDLQFSNVDYRPIASLTFALEKLIFGVNNPQISHMINLILYLCCTVILFVFVKALTNKSNLSLLITGIFALLPLHTSLMGNIKNRDNLLSFFFGFIFSYCFLMMIKQNIQIKKIIYFLLGIVSCFISVFSKLDGIMFVISIPLIYLVVYQKINIKNIFRILILGLLSFKAATSIFNIWTNKKAEIIADKSPELTSDPLIFTENPIINYPELLNKIAYSIQTTFEYITFIFKPINHFFYYGYDMLPVLPLLHIQVIIKGVFILLLLLIAIYYLKRNAFISYGIFFFFFTISYCINLLQPIAGIVADRYAFIASAGASIAMGAALYQIIQYLISHSIIKLPEDKVLTYLLIGIAIFYTPFNHVRSKEWKNYYTLLDADMPKLQNKSYEANRIAMRFYIEEAYKVSDFETKQNLLDKGLFHAQTALKIYQDNYLPYEGITLAHYGKGNIQEAKNSAYRTITKFDTILETTYRILNDIYLKESKLDSIEWTYFHLNKAVPNNNELILKYAEYTFKNGHPERGLFFCDSILSIYPQQAGAFQAKGYIYFGLKDSLQGSENSIKAFELGIRDMILLDATGYYWWPRDQEKYESLKKYL